MSKLPFEPYEVTEADIAEYAPNRDGSDMSGHAGWYYSAGFDLTEIGDIFHDSWRESGDPVKDDVRGPFASLEAAERDYATDEDNDPTN